MSRPVATTGNKTRERIRTILFACGPLSALSYIDRDVPIRTLWHTIYEPAAGATMVSFHVRDSGSGEIRSPWLRFSQTPTAPARPASRPLTEPEGEARRRPVRLPVVEH